MQRRIYLVSLILTVLTLAPVSRVLADGNISGIVTYKGAVPKFKEIKMDADPICLSKHSESVLPQTLVLGENNAMANVFVRVIDAVFDDVPPPPKDPVVINQEGCMYDPHVLGVRVGQPVKILNPDGTLHNVHALSKVNPEFNLAMPKFRKETSKVFDKPEFMFPIKCDVHPWMGAWIAVMDHPYFDVTETNGRFLIKNLTPGEYTVEAWHEKLGTKTARVTVKEFGDARADFTFSR